MSYFVPLIINSKNVEDVGWDWDWGAQDIERLVPPGIKFLISYTPGVGPWNLFKLICTKHKQFTHSLLNSALNLDITDI